MNLNEQLDFMLNFLIKEIEKPIDVPNDFNSKKDLLRALRRIFKYSESIFTKSKYSG